MGTTYGPKRFTPLSLSPALWLSDTGSDPAVWEDLSGNGRNATQADSNKRPAIVTNVLNGRQVRRFDGVNDLLIGSFVSSSAWTFFALFAVKSFSLTPTAVYQRVISQRGSGSLNDYNQTGHYIPILQDTSTSNFGSWANSGMRVTSSSTVDVFELRTSVHTGSLIENFKNSVSTGTYSHTLGNNGALFSVGCQPNSGGDGFFYGDICEIIAFPTALSTTNRRTVERYLAGKYGITIT